MIYFFDLDTGIHNLVVIVTLCIVASWACYIFTTACAMFKMLKVRGNLANEDKIPIVHEDWSVYADQISCMSKKHFNAIVRQAQICPTRPLPRIDVAVFIQNVQLVPSKTAGKAILKISYDASHDAIVTLYWNMPAETIAVLADPVKAKSEYQRSRSPIASATRFIRPGQMLFDMGRLDNNTVVKSRTYNITAGSNLSFETDESESVHIEQLLRFAESAGLSSSSPTPSPFQTNEAEVEAGWQNNSPTETARTSRLQPPASSSSQIEQPVGMDVVHGGNLTVPVFIHVQCPSATFGFFNNGNMYIRGNNVPNQNSHVNEVTHRLLLNDDADFISSSNNNNNITMSNNFNNIRRAQDNNYIAQSTEEVDEILAPPPPPRSNLVAPISNSSFSSSGFTPLPTSDVNTTADETGANPGEDNANGEDALANRDLDCEPAHPVVQFIGPISFCTIRVKMTSGGQLPVKTEILKQFSFGAYFSAAAEFLIEVNPLEPSTLLSAMSVFPPLSRGGLGVFEGDLSERPDGVRDVFLREKNVADSKDVLGMFGAGWRNPFGSFMTLRWRGGNDKRNIVGITGNISTDRQRLSNLNDENMVHLSSNEDGMIPLLGTSSSNSSTRNLSINSTPHHRGVVNNGGVSSNTMGVYDNYLSSDSHLTNSNNTNILIASNAASNSQHSGSILGPVEALPVFGPDDSSERLCPICFDRPCSIMLLPCRHMALCGSCLHALRQEKCPMCRTRFGLFVRFPVKREDEVGDSFVDHHRHPINT